MTHYLIEFRFFGKAKYEIKNLIHDINKECHIRPSHAPIPHVTLVGPFYTKYEHKLVNDFVTFCKRKEVMSFKINCFNTFEENNVLYLDVQADDKLKDFRKELADTLRDYCTLSKFDDLVEFKFHSTIAFKINDYKFDKVKDYIKNRQCPNYENVLLRAALIKNSKILCEYDFMLKQSLSRHQALNSDILTKTFDRLKQYLIDNGRYKSENWKNAKENINKGDSLSSIKRIDLDKKGVIGKIKKLLGIKKEIYFISDTHFDHTNIIRYCKRPFNSTGEMNSIMLKNWNKTITNKDVVFFLGDLVYGRGSRHPDYWLKQLNGKIYFVKGNHEIRSKIIKYYDKLIIKYDDEELLLVHDPADIPSEWNKWVICGHHHNNRLEEFPLINPKTKQINIGVELINYSPINIKELIKLRDKKIG